MSNQLSHETSPYLLQHANNPVDWYPWGEEALQKARQQDKPILLSIGYSACHWCHVMAKESFEDAKTAEFMNRHFINIKVDREERPDLDKIYQTTLQLMTGRPGGWPLTLFLTPDKHLPFFGGTYFPKVASHGLPSFTEVMQNVVLFYQQYKANIEDLTAKIQNALNALVSKKRPSESLKQDILQQARQEMLNDFDKENGGFGTQPKFPHPTYLEQLLRNGNNNPANMNLLQAALFSLQQMAKRGFYDQIDSGFFRYCVDKAWMIPHFEKMLYDNAQLLAIYANASIIQDDDHLFQKITTELADWLIETIQSPDGGFYASISAESEGEEGRFYVWDKKEVQSILTEQEYPLIAKRFGFDLAPNFENSWHCFIAKSIEAIAQESKLTPEVVQSQLSNAIVKLQNHRQQRQKPAFDKKILTSWNALMIKGLVIASKRLQRPDWFEAAIKTLDFIYRMLYQDKRLLATYKDGRAHLMAYLDDYAYLIDAIFQVLQVTWSNAYFQWILELVSTLENYFYDDKHGGFYFTAKDHEHLIQRPKPLVDETTPSGNGIAATCLLRLGYLLGEEKYLRMADKTLAFATAAIHQMPSAYNNLLLTLEEQKQPPKMIILRGEKAKMASWQKQINQYFLPHTFCFYLDESLTNLPQALDKPIIKNKVSAYICEGNQCQAPIQDLDELISTLN